MEKSIPNNFVGFCNGKFTSRLLVRATPCSQMTHLQQESFVHHIASVKRLFLWQNSLTCDSLYSGLTKDGASIVLLPSLHPQNTSEVLNLQWKTLPPHQNSYLVSQWSALHLSRSVLLLSQCHFSIPKKKKLLSTALVYGICFYSRDPHFPRCCFKTQQDGWFLISLASHLGLLLPSRDLL